MVDLHSINYSTFLNLALAIFGANDRLASGPPVTRLGYVVFDGEDEIPV